MIHGNRIRIVASSMGEFSIRSIIVRYTEEDYRQMLEYLAKEAELSITL